MSEIEKAQPKEKADLYKVFYPLFRAGLDTQYYRMVKGTEHILDGPALYAANHIKFVDSPLLAATYTQKTGKPLRFAAKQEYFEGLGTDDEGKHGRLVKFFMEHTHMVPVDRENANPRSFQQLQQAVARHIECGDSVALHPEGTRSQDGRLHKFKSGVARIAISLAQSNPVPVVPVGITYDTYDNRRRTHVVIEFGEPITPETYMDKSFTRLPGNAHRAEHLTQIVEDRVADMTHLSQSGVFAELRKLRRAGGK